MIYVIRHGEPVHSGVFLGRLDSPLSPQGHEQARALESIEVARVYASPLKRAHETAQYINAPIEVLDDLQEMDFGLWDGKTWAEVEAQWPDIARIKLEGWFSIAPPGGEEYVHLVARVKRAWEHILQGPRPVAVVAHLVVNSAIRHLITGEDPLGYQQKYAEVRSYVL